MADTSSKTTENFDFLPEDSKKIHQSADAESTSKTESNNSNHSDENSRTVTIEIVRHKRLFEILENPRAMWKVIASLFVIVGVFFIGLALVVLKSFYPYNVIKTNPYGATIIKNEDKEVIYWLFNTAELWANSGIEVKKNDRITIRASGAANTAIHHLVDGASDDFQPEFSWVGTEGLERNTGHSAFRGQFRLVPDAPFGKLLMQIIPFSKQKNSESWIKSDTYIDGTEENGENNQIFTIGKERIELVVPCDGVLHFAVNDVVMSDKNIKDMYLESMKSLQDSLTDISQKNKLTNFIIKPIKSNPEKLNKAYLDNVFKDVFTNDSCELKHTRISLYDLQKENFGFGFYYNGINPDSTSYPLVNELIYYKDKKYRDPWYMDNVGSFLIVIERKTNK